MKVCIPLALLLATSLAAQTESTLPPGYMTTENPISGGGYGYLFGAYSNEHAQIGMSGLNGKARVVSQIAFRRDGEIGNQSPSRTWSNVAVRMGEVTAKTMSSTFSANTAGIMTDVYSAKTSWAAHSGSPTKPGAWGTSAWLCTFTSVFLYTGKQDMLTDVIFTNGSLGNGATWGTSLKTYYLDGVSVVTVVGGGASVYGLRTCNASTHSPTGFPTYSAGRPRTYAKNTGSTTTSNKFGISFDVNYSVPNTFHIQVATLAGKTGNTPGTGGKLPIDLGWCNMLQIDLTGPTLYNYFKTGSTGRWNSPIAYVPYPTFSFLVGSTIWTQAAYDDPKATTYKTKLTAASQSKIQPQPADVTWSGRMVYRGNTTSTTGSNTTFGIPLQRATYK